MFVGFVRWKTCLTLSTRLSFTKSTYTLVAGPEFGLAYREIACRLGLATRSRSALTVSAVTAEAAFPQLLRM
jgi:hypothetical protein